MWLLVQRTGRRVGRLRWIVLLILLLPIIEIAVLIWVGRAVGLWWTLGLIVLVAVVGAWLGRRETGRAFDALRRAIETGRPPTNEVTDAILVMFGAFLLILPGFVSHILALMLILPITRPWARRLMHMLILRRATQVVSPVAKGSWKAEGSWGTDGSWSGQSSGFVVRGHVVDATVVDDAAGEQSTGERDGIIDPDQPPDEPGTGRHIEG